VVFIFLLFFYYFYLFLYLLLLNSACNKVFVFPGHLNTLYFYKVARETNEELRSINADPAEGFDVGPILTIARRCCFRNLEKSCVSNVTRNLYFYGYMLSPLEEPEKCL
jgi:hypothetical protein